jgi:RNA polymerase sigma-70 factor (ECF subfamily)
VGERKEAEQDDGGLDQRFRAPLCSYFAQRVQDGDIADELTQEVFLRLMRNPGAGMGETPEIHVFKVASGVLQDWGRYRVSRSGAPYNPLGAVSETLGTPSVPLDERARNPAKDALRDLEQALSGLSGPTREIFLLSRVENVPHQEIANLHGLSLDAVEKHVLKAIAHLSARAFQS